MADLVHISLDVILVAVSLWLSFYSFRLLRKFFKGGIFESSFKAFSVSGLLMTSGIVFDIIADFIEFELFSLHNFHIILSILSVSVTVSGIHNLYKAWTKLGKQ